MKFGKENTANSCSPFRNRCEFSNQPWTHFCLHNYCSGRYYIAIETVFPNYIFIGFYQQYILTIISTCCWELWQRKVMGTRFTSSAVPDWRVLRYSKKFPQPSVCQGEHSWCAPWRMHLKVRELAEQRTYWTGVIVEIQSNQNESDFICKMEMTIFLRFFACSNET